jgi:hypothetical protein
MKQPLVLIGGKLFVFSQIAVTDATIISIDFSMTVIGHIYRACQEPFLRKLIRKGQSLFMLRKGSHRPEILASIHNSLQEHKLDFLFIDEDQSCEGAREDFATYSPLVGDGGVVALHDITSCESRKEVYRFWNEVKTSYVYREFSCRRQRNHGHWSALDLNPTLPPFTPL